MERGEHKISYIRKPFAKRSFMAAILTGAASFLGILGVYLAVAGNGNAGLYVAAIGFGSLLFSVVGLWYAWLSFLERSKNYILARISVGISGVWAVFWICLIIVGLKG